MNIGSVYVHPVFDCSATPKRANIVRLTIVRSLENGGGTASGRPFKSFDDLRGELIRINLLSNADLNDLQENFRNGLSWRAPDLIAFTDEQVMKLKLQPVGCPAPTPASH